MATNAQTASLASDSTPPRMTHGGGSDNERYHYWNGGRHIPWKTQMTCMYLVLAFIIMFFTALSSAYIVRSGMSDGWVQLSMPVILWANTIVLVACSACMELSKRQLIRKESDMKDLRRSFTRWWLAATILGCAFLGGQWMAWQELYKQGVFLTTNASHSFFFLLTGAHAVHLIFGVLALLYVTLKGQSLKIIPERGAMAVSLTATYWHGLLLVWFGVFGLMLWK